MNLFNKKDLLQIQSKGIDLKEIKTQINHFKNGYSPIKLLSAATTENGIIRFTTNEIKQLTEQYDTLISKKSIIKFVPASGAASRMFNHLYKFREQSALQKETQLCENKKFDSVYYFFKHLKNFAFYDDLKDHLKLSNLVLEGLLKNKEYQKIITVLLDETGLNYANLPKALLKFHKYKDGSRMSFEEHLVEGAVYGKNKKGNVNIHFTISPEHIETFKTVLLKTTGKYEKKFGITLNITYSTQKQSTDILAVDIHNMPFRKEDQSLMFRPGGHGALIENLNELHYDIIFIKNIDNIVPDRLRKSTYLYKKALATHLINLQQQIFDSLKILENNVNKQTIIRIENFVKENLMIRLPDYFENIEAKKAFLFKKLNRPIRVCGMVKNEGEPGGGPYWTINKQGEISLQIVETSQIDLSQPDQKEIIQTSTHFNPVDLVCGLKDYKGNKFDLTKFVDHQARFISKKSYKGKEIKVQERPGLWNGAMADWITIFVECPIITFNPVKIINDLLRKEHQE